MDALRDLRAAATCVPEQMLSSLRTIEELVDILLRDEALGRMQTSEHASSSGVVAPKDCAQMIKVPTAFLTTLAHDFANFNKLLGGLVILEETEFDLYNMVRLSFHSFRTRVAVSQLMLHVCIFWRSPLVGIVYRSSISAITGRGAVRAYRQHSDALYWRGCTAASVWRP